MVYFLYSSTVQTNKTFRSTQFNIFIITFVFAKTNANYENILWNTLKYFHIVISFEHERHITTYLFTIWNIIIVVNNRRHDVKASSIGKNTNYVTDCFTPALGNTIIYHSWCVQERVCETLSWWRLMPLGTVRIFWRRKEYLFSFEKVYLLYSSGVSCILTILVRYEFFSSFGTDKTLMCVQIKTIERHLDVWSTEETFHLLERSWWNEISNRKNK